MEKVGGGHPAGRRGSGATQQQRITRTSFVEDTATSCTPKNANIINSSAIGMVALDAGPSSLLSHKGSVVFPSLAMAERSASLRKSRSGLAQLVLQRRRSMNTPNTDDDPDDEGALIQSHRQSFAGSPRSSNISRLASVASILLLRHGSTSSTGGRRKRLVSFRTAVMAVIMLVRIQAAVERRRTAIKLQLAATPRSDGGHPSAASSLPTTARHTPSTNATQPQQQRGSFRVDASHPLPPPPNPEAAPVRPPHAPPVHINAPLESPTTAAAPHSPFGDQHAEETISHASSTSKDGLDDTFSVASWDSNDRISEASSDDCGDGAAAVRTTFFPHPRDIAQLPQEMRVHMERRALRSLQRFLAVYRFCRYISARKARRSPATIGALPAGVMDTSDIFRGWSPTMIEAAMASAYIQTCFGGTFIAYPHEPQRFVYIIIGGSACEVRRRRPNLLLTPSGPAVTPADATGLRSAPFTTKRLSPSSAQAEVLKQHSTPVVLKAASALVQQIGGADVGIFAITSCTVAVLLVSDVESAFRSDSSLGEAARAVLCDRYKAIRQDRSAAFLREYQVLLERAVQSEMVAAKSAAAAKILGSDVLTTAESSIPPLFPEGGAPSSSTQDVHDEKRETLTMNIRSSKLLEHINKDQEKLLVAKLVPQSHFAGEIILEKDSDDFKNLYFVLRGTVVAVSKYRCDDGSDPLALSSSRRHSRRRSVRAGSTAGLGLHDKMKGGGPWRDMIFSRWGPGESVGDKALYFQEPNVFTLRAETNCDLVVLKRSVLLHLMESAERSGLKQCIASGAFAVRANDPVVRLRLSSVRSIPCVEAALAEGLLQDAAVRELHSLFRIHVFPAGELITSSSATVKWIVVTSTGTAVVDVNSATPFVLMSGTPIGCTVLANMRWKYAIYAETECEGWVLPVETFVKFCRERGIVKRMTELSKEQYDLLQRTDGSDEMLFEFPTPQDVVVTALANAGDPAAKRALGAKLILPTHRILEQRSFLQHLDPDVPIPPLPHHAAHSGQMEGAAAQRAARSARRDSVNSVHSEGGGSEEGRTSSRRYETAIDAPALTLSPPPSSLTPRPSIAVAQSPTNHGKSSSSKHQGFNHVTPPNSSVRTPRPDLSASTTSSLNVRAGEADVSAVYCPHPTTIVKVTPPPDTPIARHAHPSSSSTPLNSSLLLSHNACGPSASGGMSRRRQLLYRFMENIIDARATFTSRNPQDDDEIGFDAAAYSITVSSCGSYAVDHQKEDCDPRLAAVSSPKGRGASRSTSSPHLSGLTGSTVKKHKHPLRAFTPTSFYNLRQQQRLNATTHGSGSPQRSSSLALANNGNASVVGTKRWCLTPPPSTISTSLRLRALSPTAATGLQARRGNLRGGSAGAAK